MYIRFNTHSAASNLSLRYMRCKRGVVGRSKVEEALEEPVVLCVNGTGTDCCNVVCAFCIFSMDCPTKKGGHKASTYRQIEQYPDPTRRSHCSGRIRLTAYSESFYQ